MNCVPCKENQARTIAATRRMPQSADEGVTEIHYTNVCAAHAENWYDGNERGWGSHLESRIA